MASDVNETEAVSFNKSVFSCCAIFEGEWNGSGFQNPVSSIRFVHHNKVRIAFSVSFLHESLFCQLVEMHKFLHFTFIFLSFSFGNAQRGDIDENSPLNNPCASFDTCTSCLQEPNCAWCSEQVCRFLEFKNVYIFMSSEYFNLP